MKVVLQKSIKHGMHIKFWTNHLYILPYWEKQGDKKFMHYTFAWLTFALMLKIQKKD